MLFVYCISTEICQRKFVLVFVNLTENNGKNNTIAVGLHVFFIVFWWRDKGLLTLNRMHNEVWAYEEILPTSSKHSINVSQTQRKR